MKLESLEDWTIREIEDDIDEGGKFVVFTYAISLVLITFKRPSCIYYIPSTCRSISDGWKYAIISLFLGWWGIPWGPVYTIQSLWYGFCGKDVTDDVMDEIKRRAAAPEGPDNS